MTGHVLVRRLNPNPDCTAELTKVVLRPEVVLMSRPRATVLVAA